MKISSFIVTIKDGKIVWNSDHHKNIFLKFVAQFADGKYRLEINEMKSQRSLEQNNYYWFYLTIIAETTGYEPEEVHEWAKGKFLSDGIVELFGDKVRKKKSTTKLTVGQFQEYLIKIAEKTGIKLPNTTDFYGYSYHK